MKSEPEKKSKPNFAPAIRGIQLLHISFLVALATAIIGGALQAHLLNQRHHGVALANLSLSLGVVSTGWQAMHVIIAIFTMLGLAELGKAPAEARVANLSSPALIATVVSMVLGLLHGALSQALRNANLEPRQIGSVLMGVSWIETGVYALSIFLIVEITLRLRRFAAPDDRQLADMEGLLRGGIIGVFVARMLMSYASPALATALFHGAIADEWAGYFLRLPLTLAFYGGLLWLLQTTNKLLLD